MAANAAVPVPVPALLIFRVFIFCDCHQHLADHSTDFAQ
jgi:hypothetical protein